MKLVIIFLFISSVFAKETCVTSSTTEQVLETAIIGADVPIHLKGAVIIVRRADGKETSVPAESFKVVPRKQQRVITKLATETLKSCKESIQKNNRISVLAGNGTRSGVDKNVYQDSIELKTRAGFVGGAQYQRLLNENVSIGIQGQTNRTGSLMIGLDF